MSKELLRAVPFAAGLIVIALVAGLPSGCGDQINRTDVPQHSAEGTGPAIPENQSSKGSDAHVPAPHTKPANLPDVKPLVKGWTKPAVTLVFSGEQHGYMEPCGCSVTQSGGLSRRGDLMRQLTEKGWPFAAIDLGGLVKKDNQQNKFKFQVMRTALKDLSYGAMALGPEELSIERIEPGFLVQQGTEQKEPPFVNANVDFTLFKDPSLRPALPAKIITINGHRIGVTAIFGQTLTAALFGEAGDPQIKVNDPAKSLPPAIAELKREKAEVLILLSHAEKSESVELAKKFPEFQIVATARGPEDGEDTAEHIGNTLLVTVGQKGKHVAIVGYYPDDSKRPFRYELVDLDKERFKDTPKMLDRMREYQHMLEANYDAVLKDFARPPQSKWRPVRRRRFVQGLPQEGVRRLEGLESRSRVRDPDHRSRRNEKSDPAKSRSRVHQLPHDGLGSAGRLPVRLRLLQLGADAQAEGPAVRKLPRPGR